MKKILIIIVAVLCIYTVSSAKQGINANPIIRNCISGTNVSESTPSIGIKYRIYIGRKKYHCRRGWGFCYGRFVPYHYNESDSPITYTDDGEVDVIIKINTLNYTADPIIIGIDDYAFDDDDYSSFDVGETIKTIVETIDGRFLVSINAGRYLFNPNIGKNGGVSIPISVIRL